MNTEQELKRIQEQKRLAEYKGEDRVIPAKELLDEVKSDIPAVTYNTGLSSLDDITGGFINGQLVIISAATGQGKTSFCQSLTENFIKNNHHVLWFSYELGIEEFMEKMPDQGNVFYLPRQLKQGSLAWLRERVIEGIAKHNSRIIFIDHLHYLLEMQKMAEAKSVSLLIGNMLRNLKTLAREQDVLIFLVSHIRKINLTEVPQLEDLRDSSFVAQESDIVMMMWRLRDQHNRELWTDETKLAVRKNRRKGKLGEIRMKYEDNRFVEVQPEWSGVQEPIKYKKEINVGTMIL